jgi:hypothetical protein
VDATARNRHHPHRFAPRTTIAATLRQFVRKTPRTTLTRAARRDYSFFESGVVPRKN